MATIKQIIKSVREKAANWLALISLEGVTQVGSEIKTEALPLLFDGLLLTIREFIRDRCTIRAAVLAFTTLLSMVPILAVCFSFFDFFGGGAWLTERIKPFLIASLAGNVGEKAVVVLDDLLTRAPIGALGAGGLILMVYSGLALLNSLESAFNHIWKISRGRRFLVRFRNFWVSLTLVPLLIIASLVATSTMQWVSALELALAPQVFEILQSWALPLALEWLGFFLLYRLIPNVRVKMLPAALGALIGSALWEIAKRLFLIYASKAINFHILYGTFAALPLFLIWLNVTYLILLLGMEVAYVAQNLRELRHYKIARVAKLALPDAALYLLVEVAARFCKGEPPLQMNAAAARFNLDATEFSNLLTRLVRANILVEPNSEDQALRLAKDPAVIYLDEVLGLVQDTKLTGLPEGARRRLLVVENRRLEELNKMNLKDLATASEEEASYEA